MHDYEEKNLWTQETVVETFLFEHSHSSVEKGYSHHFLGIMTQYIFCTSETMWWLVFFTIVSVSFLLSVFFCCCLYRRSKAYANNIQSINCWWPWNCGRQYYIWLFQHFSCTDCCGPMQRKYELKNSSITIHISYYLECTWWVNYTNEGRRMLFISLCCPSLAEWLFIF